MNQFYKVDQSSKFKAGCIGIQVAYCQRVIHCRQAGNLFLHSILPNLELSREVSLPKNDMYICTWVCVCMHTHVSMRHSNNHEVKGLACNFYTSALHELFEKTLLMNRNSSPNCLAFTTAKAHKRTRMLLKILLLLMKDAPNRKVWTKKNYLKLLNATPKWPHNGSDRIEIATYPSSFSTSDYVVGLTNVLWLKFSLHHSIN